MWYKKERSTLFVCSIVCRSNGMGMHDFTFNISVDYHYFLLLLQRLPSLVGRFVPFVAVAAANCVNIPLMRQNELESGIPIFDQDDNRLGTSQVSSIEAFSFKDPVRSLLEP